MVNEFAYIFWYYIFEESDSRYLRYFARNYNVRWFMEARLPNLNQVVPGLLYEVEGFNWSFVEAVGLSDIIVLFIGEESEYSLLFTSTALASPNDIVLVYGGGDLKGYDIEILRNFDVIYLHSLRYRSQQELDTMADLLSSYVEAGGGLILDTGDTRYGEDIENIPSPFPISRTSTYKESYLQLNYSTPHNITQGIDFKGFSSTSPLTISYAKDVKEGADILLYDEDRPVMVYWRWGSGKVLWTGLRLPYLIMLHQDEKNARLLTNILHFMSPAKRGRSRCSIQFAYPEPERILVHVEGASPREAIWVKMSYYPGWSAEIIGERSTQSVSYTHLTLPTKA